MALIDSQSSLKPTVLSPIPRSTLESAVQALAQSAKKLRDAYPYSNTSSSATPSSFGFSTTLNPRSSAFGAMPSSAGFGRASQFGASTGHGSNGMRDEYILSRLRPHISEYVSACFSYLPYFSYVPSSNPHHQQSQAKSHPSETFIILSAVTSQVLSQPPLTRDSLVPAILPRIPTCYVAYIEIPRPNASSPDLSGILLEASEGVIQFPRGTTSSSAFKAQESARNASSA